MWNSWVYLNCDSWEYQFCGSFQSCLVLFGFLLILALLQLGQLTPQPSATTGKPQFITMFLLFLLSRYAFCFLYIFFAYIVIMFPLLFTMFIVDTPLNVHLYLLTALAIFKLSSLFCFFWCFFFTFALAKGFHTMHIFALPCKRGCVLQSCVWMLFN